jgi:glutathione synthase/RimK-type ligase-like ATP-grasp enzyme
MAQAYIPNDGSDIRFFVSGGAVGLVIKRQGIDGSHLTNISAGGQAELLPLSTIPTEVITEVEHVSRLFKRELCGIDYMFNTVTNSYVFLEINGTPQIVNGVFASEKAQVIAESLRRHEISGANIDNEND